MEEEICFCDKPIEKSDEDKFNFKKRIVDRVYPFLSDGSMLPLTVVLTGEWGVGKSSVINLLKEEIKKKEKEDAIIISFEPLLEGKLEILDIIELFYLQIYSQVKDKGVTEIITKSMISLALLTRFKGFARANVSSVGSLEIEKDFGKDIGDLLELWKTESPKLFSEQTRELDKKLKEKNKKLYVFIDEIDRLTSEKIVNFLMFTRVLELFNSLICVVGIDYGQTIKKLCKEKYLGLCDHVSAQAYLDKLFQYKFHININANEKEGFVLNLFEKTCGNLFRDFNGIRNDFYNIIEYLNTPRQIKKWLISVKINLLLVKESLDDDSKLSFLKFLAVSVKNPFLYENFCLHIFKNKPQEKESKESIKENLKALLKLWAEKVESVLADHKTKWFEQLDIVSVFYSYIQFAQVCEESDITEKSQAKLSELLTDFFKNSEIANEDKKRVIESIASLGRVYEKQIAGIIAEKTPIEFLFNNNEERE